MDWLGRVEGIRRWSRGGERAPHKPLLLLLALGRLQHDGDGPLRFTDIEADLGHLLREFGPPRATSPGYPFHHLTNDGLWVVTTENGEGSPGPGLTDLRRSGAAGRLDPEFARSLATDPHLLAQVVRVLLDANFPPSLHAEICAAAGLDLEAAELASTTAPLPARRARSAEFRRDVLLAYEYRCSFCGYDGLLRNTAVGIDAAHVRWWAFDGPDTVANGLALCSLHHKLFDKGVLGLDEQHRVTVSAHFIGRSPSARTIVLDLLGHPMLGPQPGFDPLDPTHVTWHRQQVFQLPARQEAGA
ncbi:HNH endonuclease [Catenulispora yoronensis]|uniref:HNH endonuclease n=1 Tax=Catenulispora yoronensis TaxID=450799 RepID=A0ABP5FIT6_9ACTN